jgi:hypothetical protein
VTIPDDDVIVLMRAAGALTDPMQMGRTVMPGQIFSAPARAAVELAAGGLARPAGAVIPPWWPRSVPVGMQGHDVA